MPTLVMATHQSATFVDVNGAQIEFDFHPEIQSESITPCGVPDDLMEGLLDGLLDPNHASNATSLIFINWKSCHNKTMMKQ